MAVLEEILVALRKDYRLRLFGSRARQVWRGRSDIDILVEGESPIPIDLLARIETGLSEFALPVHVDLVDAKRSSAGFLSTIEGELRDI